MKKTFSKILAVILTFVLVFSAMPVAFAADEIASGTAGEGVNWVLDTDGTLTISGEGEIVVDWYAPPWESYINDIYVVDIQEGITNIPDTAFCYAENLVSVNVPASVTNMSENNVSPFWNCFALQEINVHKDNAAYVSVDGVVFNNDMSILCYYPPNKADSTYTIPSSVTTLATNSFNYTKNIASLTLPDTVTTLSNECFGHAKIKSIILNNNITVIPWNCFSGSSLESIVIPDSVEAIEYGAFYNCNNLKNITIGGGVKTIADSIFQYCDELTAIHYKGSEAQWNEIAIHEENEYLNNMAIHYVTDETYKDGFEPDCETDGHTGGIYCTECENYVTGNVIYAPGHDFENSTCKVCGSECNHQHYDFDGICDICGQNAPIDAINVGETKSVYIKEKEGTNIVTFTVAQNGTYVLSSNKDDINIDPYVTLYDSNCNEIGNNDDDGGEFNFKLIFTAVAGQTYYFELSSYDADSTYDITFDTYYAFTHQPSAKEPYVEFSWDNAELQWYTATPDLTPITLNNAETVSYDWGNSSYDSQNGWTGVVSSPDGETSDYDFFTVPLKAGESITVELFGNYSDGVGLWDYSQSKGVWYDLTEDTKYILTAEDDGNYTFYTFSNTGDVTVKADLVKFDYKKINGQTDAELKNLVIGTRYVCLATIDGKTVYSNIFEYTYFIAHQPISAEPYVTLNEQASDAKYQWYKLEEGVGELTDLEVEPFAMSTGASYDSETGWTGYYNSENGSAHFFYISLAEGESITVEATGNVSEISIYNPELSEYTQSAIPDENGTVTLTSIYETGYILSAVCDPDATIRAYGNALFQTAVENQTTAALTNADSGATYFCKVIVDDKLVISDTFEYYYVITHQPTTSEPYVELNDDTDATYQWCSATAEDVEITDQDSVITETEQTGVLATYDAENGWSGMRANDEVIIYFGAEFYKGQKLTFIANDNAAAVAMMDVFSVLSGETSVIDAEFDENGTATLTVPSDSVYIILVNSATDTAIKVFNKIYNYSPIENENESTLKTSNNGIYACEVTFADGTTEMSDLLSIENKIGDVNGDNRINGKDYAIILQYVNGWEVEIIKEAADVNSDGRINGRDFAMVLQSVNGWDVILG